MTTSTAYKRVDRVQNNSKESKGKVDSKQQDVKAHVRLLRKHMNKFQAIDSVAWRILFVTVSQLFLCQYIIASFSSNTINYLPTILTFNSWLGWAIYSCVVGYTGLLILRAFIIYHDCVHQSFFTSKYLNTTIGSFLSFLVLTPVHTWNHYHSRHHHHFGNLDTVDTGQTILWTKQEWESFPLWKRSVFRLFREPLIFHMVYPPFKFFFEYPVVYGDMYASLGLACHILFAVFLNPGWAIGFAVGGIFGILLFHFQHSVNTGFREPKEKWSFDQAGLLGSTYQLIPFPFSIFTMGIEFHHIHHLSTKVPGYRLANCHNEAPSQYWDGWVTKVNLRGMLKSFGNTLYDEKSGLFVPFSYSLF